LCLQILWHASIYVEKIHSYSSVWFRSVQRKMWKFDRREKHDKKQWASLRPFIDSCMHASHKTSYTNPNTQSQKKPNAYYPILVILCIESIQLSRNVPAQLISPKERSSSLCFLDEHFAKQDAVNLLKRSVYMSISVVATMNHSVTTDRM